MFVNLHKVKLDNYKVSLTLITVALIGFDLVFVYFLKHTLSFKFFTIVCAINNLVKKKLKLLLKHISEQKQKKIKQKFWKLVILNML